MFLKGPQSLPGLPKNLRFVVACDILGSQKFRKYLERVAIQKSLRTLGLVILDVLVSVTTLAALAGSKLASTLPNDNIVKFMLQILDN
jgi:hypothetical protein